MSDNLSAAESCLISSKSCLTSYQIFHVWLQTTSLSQRTSDNKES